MRMFITAALAAAVALPAAAQAQSHSPYRHDSPGRYDYDRDHHWGHDDWRSWRDHNRTLYARGSWRAPFAYHAFRTGMRISPTYYGSRYWIADPWRYHLPPARPNTRWVRHYNDVLLIDYRRGVVLDVIHNFYF